ncbi:hypothetical protein AVEN_155467-1 [Araneus ventricosus]|uniref:Uncharacterized protein n=1 Tax=Araneus ventricosus TaxID=182803 RepID=A0A4Y2TUW9_ARAVE|nr:hypothetical protein AVEN_98451-1 [Araneus ventricosus]GBO03434.1 hypothetical protein AVEN_155467-1 [Araneus ventricosus]
MIGKRHLQWLYYVPGGDLASAPDLVDYLLIWRQNRDSRIFNNYGSISHRNRKLDFCRHFSCDFAPFGRAINTRSPEEEGASFPLLPLARRITADSHHFWKATSQTASSLCRSWVAALQAAETTQMFSTVNKTESENHFRVLSAERTGKLSVIESAFTVVTTDLPSVCVANLYKYCLFHVTCASSFPEYS